MKFYHYFINHRKPSQWALDQAKKRVEEEYLLVGLTEDFDSTVVMLEKLAPDLFQGITRYYQSPKSGTYKSIL